MLVSRSLIGTLKSLIENLDEKTGIIRWEWGQVCCLCIKCALHSDVIRSLCLKTLEASSHAQRNMAAAFDRKSPPCFAIISCLVSICAIFPAACAINSYAKFRTHARVAQTRTCVCCVFLQKRIWLVTQNFEVNIYRTLPKENQSAFFIFCTVLSILFYQSDDIFRLPQKKA